MRRILGVLFIAAISLIGARPLLAQDQGEMEGTAPPASEASPAGEGSQAPIIIVVPIGVVFVPLPTANPPSPSPQAPAPPAKPAFGAPPLGTSPY